MNDSSSRKYVAATRGLVIVVALLAVLAAACGVVVSETENVLVLRFGKPVRILDTPGFYLKFPTPVETLVRVDRRLQHAPIRLSETLTRDQRNVVVPVYFTWRVSDPLLFHTSVRDFDNARRKLDALITSARNSVLGNHPFGDLVAVDNRPSHLPDIEEEIRTLCATDASKQLGVELIATGITQIQLPEANTASVFRRMRAERKREAELYRAEGRAKAAEMKAETDKEANRLIAEAKRDAEEIRGRAEAHAASIYADAHGQAPSFYRFLRELQSLRSVVDKNTTVVLDTSIAPFHWLKFKEGNSDPVKALEVPPGTSSATTISPALLDPTP